MKDQYPAHTVISTDQSLDMIQNISNVSTKLMISYLANSYTFSHKNSLVTHEI